MLNNLNSFSSETKQSLRTRDKLKKKKKNHLNWLGTVLEENAMELVFPIDGASGARRVAGDGVVCHFDATRLIRTAANNARKPWSGWGRWWRRRWRQQRRRWWCREIHIRCYDWIPLPLNLDDVRTSRFSLQTPWRRDWLDMSDESMLWVGFGPLSLDSWDLRSNSEPNYVGRKACFASAWSIQLIRRQLTRKLNRSPIQPVVDSSPTQIPLSIIEFKFTRLEMVNISLN